MESESISHFRLDLLSLLLNGDSALALTDVSALDLLPLVFDDGDSASALTLTAALADVSALDLLPLVFDDGDSASALTLNCSANWWPSSWSFAASTRWQFRRRFSFNWWPSPDCWPSQFAGIPIAAAVASLTALEAVAVTPIAVSAASTSSWSKTPV